nr:ABC transporter permease [Lentzea fradiae]
MLFVHARTEAVLTLRNGEQILLTVLIPLALLVALSVMPVIPMPEPRAGSAAARIFALAIISSAFTGQAIALGFDRRYGVLKRLAASALPRWLLVSGRVCGALVVAVLQIALLAVTALVLGWRFPLSGLPWLALLIVLGTLTFGALGVLLGGALRAEIVLALANIIWFVLLLVGGVALSASVGFVHLLPSAALAEAMEAAVVHGTAPGVGPVAVLVAWGVVAGAVATRTTRLT